MKATTVLLLALAAGPALASPAIATKASCVACHQPDKKVMGPSYKDIAARYKGQADAPKVLAERVRKGSKGVWGELPMPPTPPDKLSDADLKAVVSWVLKAP